MAKAKVTEDDNQGLPFDRTNYILMGCALLCVIIGYIALGSGSITLAPILLVLGYCVLFPAGIIWGTRQKKAETGD